MCIVIDTNTLASVFDRTSAKHNEFKPVLDWIRYGKGQVVFGGSVYEQEIKKKYLALFSQLKKANKAVRIDNKRVDKEEAKAKEVIPHADFDDPHIVGLLIASGCKLICSLDERAYPFFRHHLFFSPASKKPKIYRGKGNKDLLKDKNIAEVCLPSKVTTNAQRKILSGI